MLKQPVRPSALLSFFSKYLIKSQQLIHKRKILKQNETNISLVSQLLLIFSTHKWFSHVSTRTIPMPCNFKLLSGNYSVTQCITFLRYMKSTSEFDVSKLQVLPLT